METSFQNPAGGGVDMAQSEVDAARRVAELLERVERDFQYHAPTDEQIKRMSDIRNAARELASLVVKSCPSSRELSAALTHLEQVSMYANAAIARNE